MSKGMFRKKTSTGIELVSPDKALTVTVKVFTAKELSSMAAALKKEKVDTLDVLASVLKERSVARELDPATHNLPAELLSPVNADAGSALRYGSSSKNVRYVCRSCVYAKSGRVYSVGYAIVDKQVNEKYEKIANEIMKSFVIKE